MKTSHLSRINLMLEVRDDEQTLKNLWQLANHPSSKDTPEGHTAEHHARNLAAKLGKNVGDDFREGKITLPVVLSFRRGSTVDRAFWRRTLEQGEVVDGALESALALMKKHRALEDTVERARLYGAMARDALELFPPSAWKHALLDAVEFAIQRAH